MTFRTGFGYDSHRLVPGRGLWLGGIKIDFDKGLDGHSDADVLLHAICDALLGAASLRDIGYHFPDTDPAFSGIDSKELLRRTVALIKDKGFVAGNIDATVCAEQPKLAPYIEQMRQTIAGVIGIDVDSVSVKATTNERMGFVGRQEGIAAFAVALIHN
ncbi:MAG: 2-C-methyl-D-erythritol 2,4-cyclodiphosphate synthase [Prevotella sp.]|nr:2-C-methyl-D-erythritol 2,4-cyclodiphosphate synthase [Prevotella sp.]